jgi:hypothetical protein
MRTGEPVARVAAAEQAPELVVQETHQAHLHHREIMVEMVRAALVVVAVAVAHLGSVEMQLLVSVGQQARAQHHLYLALL